MVTETMVTYPCLLLVLLLVTLPESYQDVANVSVGDQAKIQTSLEAAKDVLDEWHTHLKEVNHNIQSNVLDTTSIINTARSVGLMLKAVSVAGTIFSVVSTFFLPSELDVITELFEDVNDRLDGINGKLDDISDKLDHVIGLGTYNDWLTTHIVWEFAIHNGQMELDELVRETKTLDVNEKRQKLKLQHLYVEQYQSRDIEGAINNIYRLTGQAGTPTTENLYELFLEARGCNLLELVRFHMKINSAMISGLKQAYAYQLLQSGRLEKAQEEVDRISGYMYAIRDQFDQRVWHCLHYAMRYAKRTVTEMAATTTQDSWALVDGISTKLHRMYDQYEWSVAVWDNDHDYLDIDHVISITGYMGHTIDREHPHYHQGHNYFTIPSLRDVRPYNIMVVWQDAEDTIPHPCRVADGHTIVYMEGCDKCVTRLSQKMITTVECPEESKQFMEHDGFTLIAAKFREPVDPCREPDACSHHGTCKHIPGTDRKYCICDPFYNNVTCADYDAVSRYELDSLLADLRLNNAGLRGIPTVIDVYLDLQQIPERFDEVTELTRSLFQGNALLIIYAQAFNDAEYISECYKDLLLRDINEEVFAHRLRFKNIHETLRNMKKAIMGEGTVWQVGTDLTTAVKKQLRLSKCSKAYHESVSNLHDKLLWLDESVSEAFIRLEVRKATLNANGITQSDNILRDVEDKTVEAAARQTLYARHWNQTSCPTLLSSDCGRQDSYKDMTVGFVCPHPKQPTPATVKCEQKDGTLQWNTNIITGVCVYVWSAWSRWSPCTRHACSTTDWTRYRKQSRTRTRSKPDGNRETRTDACPATDCCLNRYDRFKCGDGKCLQKEYVCNGIYDCSDKSDEANCPYLKVGNYVSLRDHCEYEYLRMSEYWGYMHVTSDPRYFKIDAKNRIDGDAVRYGDWIALENLGTPGRWLSCSDSNRCDLKTCPGLVMSVSEYTSCYGETFKLYDVWNSELGGLVNKKDGVRLMYEVGDWVATDGDWRIRLRECPGHPSVQHRKWCRCELWTIDF